MAEKTDRGFGLSDILNSIDKLQALMERWELLLQRLEDAIRLLEGKKEGGETRPEEIS